MYLRLIENAPELKRKMPTSPHPRTMKEGLYDISRLVGIDQAAFKEPQNIAALSEAVARLSTAVAAGLPMGPQSHRSF